MVVPPSGTITFLFTDYFGPALNRVSRLLSAGLGVIPACLGPDESGWSNVHPQ